MQRIKFRTKVLLLLLLISTDLFAFEIHTSEDLDVKMGVLVGSDYSYTATHLPGLSAFSMTDMKVNFKGSYKNLLSFKLAIDLADIDVENQPLNIVKDVYGKYHKRSVIQFQAGHFRSALGEEIQRGPTKRNHIYHSIASKEIVPDRSVGFAFLGKKVIEHWSYSVHFQNSSLDDTKEETGHHTLSSKVGFKSDILSAGYSNLLNTDKTFSQALFCSLNFKFSERYTLTLFSEYIEQRYYQYYWNRSVYTNLTFNSNTFEYLLYYDYYDNIVSGDGADDKWILGGGINKSFLKKRMRLLLDVHSNYHLTLAEVYNKNFYDTKITLKLLVHFK